MSTRKTRDAAQNWNIAYAKFMKSIGFGKGRWCARAFWHPTNQLRVAVRGDDFTVLGWPDALDWFWGKKSEHFERKHRGRMGPGKEDIKSIRILNWMVKW